MTLALLAAEPVVAPVVTSATSGFSAEYTAIIPVATVAGVAVGFGAQRIVQDLLAGFFLFAAVCFASAAALLSAASLASRNAFRRADFSRVAAA